MQKNKGAFKKIAVALATLFLGIALIFCSMYFVAHAEHNCSSEDTCSICVCVEACKKMIDGSSMACASLPILAFALCLCIALALLLYHFAQHSLADLKIRLNN